MPFTSAEHADSSRQNVNVLAETFWEKTKQTKKKSKADSQNPEVLDAREVHFGDSGDVVSVQISAERETRDGVSDWIFI